MGWLLKAAAGVIVAVLVCAILAKQGKEYAHLVSIAACCLILCLGFGFLQPVVDLMNQLQSLGNLQPDWLTIMLKAVGIGLIVEIGVLICSDAGNAALGKSLQIVGAIALLWVSIPLMTALIELLNDILGEI